MVTLAKALKGLGHRVFVISSGGDLVKKLQGEGIFHLRLNIDTKSEMHPKILMGIYHLYWFIRENNIDIVHTHTRVTQVMGEASSRLTGVNHISTCHGFFRPRLGRRLCGCWGKKVIAISEAVREHLVNDFRLKKSKVVLVHNGIDLEAFKRPYTPQERETIKRELRLSQGPVVGIISRLSSVKGHKFLVMAMKTVVEKFKGAQLLIVGEGEEEIGLKDMVEKLGLLKSVIFEKTILDTARVLSVIDVFVLPSIKEGLGLALLEALCCGKPAVASDVGGIYSIIRHGSTGLLVPPKDPDALAGAILKLLGDERLRESLGEAGQRLVYDNFSLLDMARKVELVYKEVAARG